MDKDLIGSTDITLLLIENLNNFRSELFKLVEKDIKTSSLDILIYKLCNSCFSFCTIYTNDNMSKNSNFKDIGSLYTLSRSVIENFLTIEYLFLNECSNEENDFRFQLWTLSGILSRHKDHQNAPYKYRQKLDKEIIQFENLKKDFFNLKYYKSLDKKVKERLKKQLTIYGSSRFNFSWYTLINKSNISEELFKEHYNLSSNYAHSEFHSIAQIRDLNINNKKEEYLMFTTPIISMLNIVCSTLFILINKQYNLDCKIDLNNYDINLISFYNLIYTKKNL